MADAWLKLAPEAWPAAARYEIAGIERVDGVVSGTAEVWRAEADAEAPWGRFHIRFGMAAPGLPEPVVSFQNPEPIILAWSDAGQVGRMAPVVLSGRDDFPRDLKHLNPFPEGWPASFCLSLAGLNDIYQRFGIVGVVQRLRQWLVDAAAGSLDADGWHPVPLASLPQGRRAVALLVDPAFVQELAAGGAADGFVAGVARGTEHWTYAIPAVHAVEGGRGCPSPLAEARSRYIEDERQAGLRCEHFPWALVWNHEATEAPTFGYVEKLGDLLERLAPVGLRERATAAIVSVEAQNVVRRIKNHDKAMLLLVAIRRPRPLMPGMQGLSSDPLARSYELAAYLITGPTERGMADEANAVIQCAPRSWASPAVFRHTSGVPPLAGVAVFGAGALGSALVDLGLRAGLDDLSVFDKDFIEPHNLARHGALFADIGSPKAKWAEGFAKALGPVAAEGAPDLLGRKAEFWVRGHTLDVISATDEELKSKLTSARVLVDATANALVRSRLCALTPARRVIRAEIFDQGRLGVLCVGAATHNPDPFDLYHVLCTLYGRDDAVKEWLRNEHAGQVGLEEMIVGFGCASTTVRLPKWAVDLHATAFMPSLVDAMRAEGAVPGAGVGINALNDRLQPRGWRWYDVPAFHEFVRPDIGWSVRVHPEALERIRTLRGAALPAETGGYLFGGWDRDLKRVTVVAVTPAPPGTSGTASDLALASVDQCPTAAALLRRSAGRLHLVGTWHSHPDGCPRPSGKDVVTMSAMAADNRIIGMPTLMLIQADGPWPAIALSCGGDDQ
ncbi:Mov34/MPN/PAD-1 family protein [Azospirillum soli]|uniref:Mov34/MPN/PAD-1 family protein n=1 Tax=Azospirillum soli TaxID=1304799 RepID=UPI001AE76560|nr:Mov34/MPN/PAD-1 family protein [Azospirillum soli]MBP2311499.1 proteasome lid subunit RPN8/RPN11 [Azospirillum soli]